jgi:hypothetical protein
MRRNIRGMPELARQLDQAGAALGRSVRRVRRGPAYTLAAAKLREGHAEIRPRQADSALDQSIAALQGAVWIAAFVQAVFDEIRGRGDEG